MLVSAPAPSAWSDFLFPANSNNVSDIMSLENTATVDAGCQRETVLQKAPVLILCQCTTFKAGFLELTSKTTTAMTVFTLQAATRKQ